MRHLNKILGLGSIVLAGAILANLPKTSTTTIEDNSPKPEIAYEVPKTPQIFLEDIVEPIGFPIYPFMEEHPELKVYFTKIREYAGGFDPDLIMRQIWKESRGDSLAISKKYRYGNNPLNGRNDRAYGVMQVKIDTGRYYGLEGTDAEVIQQLFDPDINIPIGLNYLKKCYDKFGGRIDQALAAYNAGPGTIAPALIKSSGPATITEVSGFKQYSYDREINWKRVPREPRLYVRDILGEDAPKGI